MNKRSNTKLQKYEKFFNSKLLLIGQIIDVITWVSPDHKIFV